MNYATDIGRGAAIEAPPQPALLRLLANLNRSHEVTNAIEALAEKLVGTEPAKSGAGVSAVPSGLVGELDQTAEALVTRLNAVYSRLSQIA